MYKAEWSLCPICGTIPETLGGQTVSDEPFTELIGAFVDGGIFGTTFDRPDLNHMIKDAMDDTRPTGIMVKDMSRFGRNNAMFMYYVEEIFPYNAILFIALNDDVDTRRFVHLEVYKQPDVR